MDKIVEKSNPSEALPPKKILAIAVPVLIPYALFVMNFLGHVQKLITGVDSISMTFGYVLFEFIVTFLCLFAIPYYLAIVRWKLKPKSIGLIRGNVKLGVILLLISVLSIPLIYIGSEDPQLINTYPLAKSVLGSTLFFIFYEFLYAVLYYIPYEFFFRGFVQLGLGKTWGNWKSILFATILTTCLHLFKPLSEFISAFLVGFLFGYIAIKTKSWYYVFGIHFFIGMLTDIFCGMRYLGILPF